MNQIAPFLFKATVFSMLSIAGFSYAAKEYSVSKSIEKSGANCAIPALPEYEILPDVEAFPDPFLSLSGKRISKRKHWACRRAETAAQFQKYELGIKPAKPERVTGKFEGNSLVVSVEHNGKSISYTAEIILPEKGTAPYPAVIGIGRSFLNNDVLSKLGVAVINFPNNDLGEQKDGSSRGKGKFFELYGNDHSASAMTAWAWGVSRLIDALEHQEEPRIDYKHLGVTGCSRNGKGALVAGAFDERIALTIPQESGSGGSASWRVSDAQRIKGQNVQTLRQIVTENVWLRESFSHFSESATKLPVDHHQLMAMVAPRALLVVENTSMEWLGNESAYTTGVVAKKVWQALGYSDRMAMTQIGGHDHCRYPDSQLAPLTAYVSKFLLGEKGHDTDIMESDGAFKVDVQRWAPWSTPSLK